MTDQHQFLTPMEVIGEGAEPVWTGQGSTGSEEAQHDSGGGAYLFVSVGRPKRRLSHAESSLNVPTWQTSTR